MRDSTDLVTRIERLCSRASVARPTGELLREIEDLLAEGYLKALAGEARSRRLAERLETLRVIVEQTGTASDIRRIVRDKRRLDAEVSALRDRLSLLREQFVRQRALSRSG